MQALRHRLLAALLSLGLLMVLLTLVILGNQWDVERPETLVIREVALAAPPPPPPAVADNKARSAATADLRLATPEAAVQMLNLDLVLDLPEGALPAAADIGGGQGGTGSTAGIELAVDWSGLSLGELDGYPVVLQAPPFNFPRSLVDGGVRRIELNLHILIDESGQPFLLRVLDSQDDVLAESVERWVRSVRFSPPTLAGVPVKAEFNWPVVLSRP